MLLGIVAREGAMDHTDSSPEPSMGGGEELPPAPSGGADAGRTRSRRAAIGLGAAAAAVAVVGGGAALAQRAGLLGGGLTLKVNGRDHSVAADPSTPLLYVLRNELGLQGPRFGCGLSQCGACTVQLDGKPVRSCVTAVSSVSGRAVTTLEGLGTAAHPHPLQKAFIDQQAVQCGYCISGIIMESEAFLRSRPKPSDADIKNALAGHLCRCGTHYRIVRAVRQAAGVL
jgi:nicotinate dehydrogenase subunit A